MTISKQRRANLGRPGAAYVGSCRFMLCRCGGLKFALGSVGVGLVVISWIERQQFGTQMPQGAIHPITRSPRRRGRAGGSPRWDGRTTKPTAPSEKETEKERGSDDNRDRAGRSGFSANLDLQREGHGDDRARH